MRKRIVTGLLALSLVLIPVCADAAAYRANGYCVKTFNTKGGKITASVSYAKNTSLFKDTIVCLANTSGDIGVTAYCSYNETVYKSKLLVGKSSLLAKETEKNISRTYTYGKLALTGDTKNTLFADE